MSEWNPIEKGSTFEVVYPFFEVDYVDITEDGSSPVKSWSPGVIGEMIAPDDCEMVAHAQGKMILNVIDVHKPGNFPTRIFYTRSWIDPDGKHFGKNKLHITTIGAFKRRATGYFHEYRLVAPPTGIGE